MSDDRISGRQEFTDAIVSTGPDVCWTPRGGAMVPVPYSCIAFANTAVRLSMSVRNNENYDFQLNSTCTMIYGHEAGTGKGVVVPGYKKYSHVRIASDYIFSEGFATCAHRDPAWINHPDLGPTEPHRDTETFEV